MNISGQLVQSEKTKEIGRCLSEYLREHGVGYFLVVEWSDGRIEELNLQDILDQSIVSYKINKEKNSRQ